MSYARKATLDEITRYGSGSGLKSPIDRREFLKLAGEIGFAAALAACGDNPIQPTNGIPPSNPGPSQYLATGTIQDLHTGAIIPSGKINANGIEIDIADGNYKVSTDMRLSIGSRYRVAINANGYEPRELTALLTPNGFEADLGGGRKETPLTVYRDSGSFSVAEYAAFCLRYQGALQRIISPLRFAIFDTRLYQLSNGRYIDKGEFPMRQTTKDNLMKVLREDAPFWTDNKIYTPENIESYIHLQSRGDDLPPIINNREDSQPGWIIITQRDNLPPGWAISQGDNGYTNGGVITAGNLDAHAYFDVSLSGWTEDIIETFGYVQVRGIRILPEKQPYAAVMFSRPVGHTTPDKSP